MIGIFDSGIGGLSILKAIRKKLPQYSYLYFADTKNVPYGDKTADEIYNLTQQAVELLFERGCQIVILACNSASACALRKLQQEWLPNHYPDRRVLGILVPTIEQISEQYHSLGILATRATIASGAYERELRKRKPRMELIQQACPGLVELIEEGAADDEIADKIKLFVKTLLRKNNHPPEAILLGCTHYSLKHDLFRNIIPKEIALFDQPGAVAESLGMYLLRHSEISKNLKQGADVEYVPTKLSSRLGKI